MHDGVISETAHILQMAAQNVCIQNLKNLKVLSESIKIFTEAFSFLTKICVHATL